MQNNLKNGSGITQIPEVRDTNRAYSSISCCTTSNWNNIRDLILYKHTRTHTQRGLSTLNGQCNVIKKNKTDKISVTIHKSM